MDRIPQALFALLRAGLWGRYDEAMASVFPLSPEEWDSVFTMARQQTVTGIVFRGLDFLPEEAAPSMGIAARWMAYADHIEHANVGINKVIARIYSSLAASGQKAVLQKGQGIAAMYPEPLLRECGDIDLYFPEHDGKSDPLAGVSGATREMHPDGSWLYFIDGIPVEHHSYLIDIQAPRSHRYVEGLISEKGYETMLIGEGTEVTVPAPEVNLLLLSTHILKHALGVGIGLRQVCDMAVAMKFYEDKVSREAMREVYRGAGIQRWSELLEDFIVKNLYGVEPNFSGILLDIVLKGGNFGVYSKDRVNASRAELSRKWHTFRSFAGNIGFALKYAPREWFWTMVQLMGGQLR